MKKSIAVLACALIFSGAAQAASRTYDVESFDRVVVAAGIDVQIHQGSTFKVEATTSAENFDDLEIARQGNQLRIDRPRRSWFMSWRRPKYEVRVTMPALRALTASSGAEVDVRGAFRGDLVVKASSGSEITVQNVEGGAVTAQASSGSDLEIAGRCTTLKAHASSGADLHARGLRCETAEVRASSGSDVSLLVTQSVTGAASSGSGINVRGRPAHVDVNRSSGAAVKVGT